MLIQQISSNRKEIQTKEREIEVVVGDDADMSFSFGFRSLTKLNNQTCSATTNFSVLEIASNDPFDFESIFSDEFEVVKKKYEKFKDSTSFIGKLSSLAFASGKSNVAIREIESIIQVKKSNNLKHQLSDIFLHDGRLGDAESVLEGIDESDILCNLKLAYLKFKNNNMELATNYLESALKIDPSDSRVQMFLGALYLSNGECEKAIRSFRIACETRKDSSSLHANLAVSHLTLGNVKKAIAELRRSIELNPLNENAIVLYSDLLFREKKYEACIPQLEFFVKFNESSEYGWERLARSYFYGKKYKKAKIALGKLTELSSEPSNLNNIGLVTWKLGDLKKSLSYLVNAVNYSLDKGKDISVPLLNLTILLNEIKHPSKVVDIVDDCIKSEGIKIKEEIFSEICIQYLIALESMSKYHKATEFIDKYVGSRFKDINNAIPIIVSKLYLSTAVNSNKDEFYKYSKHLAAIIIGEDINPDRKMMVVNNLMFGYLFFDDMSSAKILVNNIIPYLNKDPFCTATFGLYKMKRGEIEKGLEFYQSAISLTKNREFKTKIRQRMFLELGKIYLNRNDFKKAKESFQKAVKEKSGYKYAAEEGNIFLKLISDKGLT
ncbi:hypothetical protein DSOUD_1598 [Desulfuromonas soudanensis]|uniref:Tetratricopeptide repeat protein n=1 Tax=Desulfuromonas soudanensis TaxID=1603606 RepID=A0A0M4D285_9BACT|nr:tetratricopeptide repeat protein [Desulfuromonas soudanensis]ALC16376.1 hypothetical protein DSOUD_1598 [Desulfuromonas soudanensis]